MTNEPERAGSPGVTDAWREALASRRTRPADGAAVPGAQASRPDDGATSRRNFIRASFWGGLGLSLLGALVSLADFLYPRGISGFGGPVSAGNIADYPPGGDPVESITGQFWLVNLDPGETRPGGSGGGSGLLALWRKCPHLGCSVPWQSGFNFEGDAGWFRCPCHGSTYTKSGIRVFGPAPRSMTTMKVEVDANGNITVQTGDRTDGGPDNPQRALPVG